MLSTADLFKGAPFRPGDHHLVRTLVSQVQAQLSRSRGNDGSGANFRNQYKEALGNVRGSGRENCLPDFWLGFAADGKLAEFELTS